MTVDLAPYADKIASSHYIPDAKGDPKLYRLRCEVTVPALCDPSHVAQAIRRTLEDWVPIMEKQGWTFHSEYGVHPSKPHAAPDYWIKDPATGVSRVPSLLEAEHWRVIISAYFTRPAFRWEYVPEYLADVPDVEPEYTDADRAAFEGDD